MRSTNASNSWRARRTQITSSNSSSWQFVGDRRSCARSGRWTMTLRSVPTSEATPSAGVVDGVATGVLLSAQDGRTADEQAGDHEGHRDEGPDELQVAVVAHLGKGEATHDHSRGRGDQV